MPKMTITGDGDNRNSPATPAQATSRIVPDRRSGLRHHEKAPRASVADRMPKMTITGDGAHMQFASHTCAGYLTNRSAIAGLAFDITKAPGPAWRIQCQR